MLAALPRGKRFEPLVSEYGSYHTVLHARNVDKVTDLVPTGAKLVHQRLVKRGDVRVDEPILHSSTENITEGDEIFVSQFGMPREPLDFCARAVNVATPEAWRYTFRSWFEMLLNKIYQWSQRSWPCSAAGR